MLAGNKNFIVTLPVPVSSVYSNSTGGGALRALGWPENVRNLLLQSARTMFATAR